jgi:hypothetical protein
MAASSWGEVVHCEDCRLDTGIDDGRMPALKVDEIGRPVG